MTKATPRPTMSPLAKFAMGFQAFMLRRNWMGAMGDFVMVINVTGRKSGKKYATPIGYVRDGSSLIALTRRGAESQWYKNALTQEVLLEVKGVSLRARMTPINDEAERGRIIELYKQKLKPDIFKRTFGGLTQESSAAELQAMFATRQFVRFEEVK